MNNPTPPTPPGFPPMLTPVTTLMCEDLRLSTILTDTGPIHKKEMQMFLGLVEDAVNRWYSALGKLRPSIYFNYNEHVGLVSHLNFLFGKASVVDDEEIFAIRRELHETLHEFYHMVDHLADVFTGPRELREFYFNINSRLMSTSETLLEGKNGW